MRRTSARPAAAFSCSAQCEQPRPGLCFAPPPASPAAKIGGTLGMSSTRRGHHGLSHANVHVSTPPLSTVPVQSSIAMHVKQLVLALLLPASCFLLPAPCFLHRQFTPTASFPASAPYCCSGPSTALVACSSTWRAADVRSRPGPGSPPLSLVYSRMSGPRSMACDVYPHTRSASLLAVRCWSRTRPLHPVCTLPCPPGTLHQVGQLLATALVGAKGPLAGHWPV